MSGFKENIFNKMDLKSAEKILDLGCGHGQQLIKLSQLVERKLELYGIDKLTESIKIAEQNVEDLKDTAGNKYDNFEFLKHDINDGLPFADNSFDIVFSINLLECILDKNKLLKEIYRILKPEGQIVMAHHDFDTQLFDGSDKKLIRKIVTSYSDWQQDWMDKSDPWMGRRLWRVINGSGLFTGQIDTYVLTETDYNPDCYGYEMANSFNALVSEGLISNEEYNKFIKDLEKLAVEDKYFYSINMYVFTEKKNNQ